MGLHINQGAFNGSYSTFNNFRRAILKSYNGMDLFNFKGFEGVKRNGEVIEYKGLLLEDYIQDKYLLLLLNHSDCEGEIIFNDCKGLSEILFSLYDKIDRQYLSYLSGFIVGCDTAFKNKKDLIFS